MTITSWGGGKILDTHLGSGSSRIVAYQMGFDFYGCEIDKDYYDAQQKRFEEECLHLYTDPVSGRITQELNLFDNEENNVQ